jgi:hypothetical protein
MGKAPGLAGTFLISIFSLADWVELIGTWMLLIGFGLGGFGA